MTLESIADYFLKEYKNGMACSQTIRDMSPAILEEPRRPDELNDQVKLAIFNEEVREYVKDKKSFMGNLNSACGLILGQCTPSMKCEIESHRDYEAFRKNGNLISLLKAMQEIDNRCKLHQCLALQLYKGKRKLFLLTQKREDLVNGAYKKGDIDPYLASEINKDRLLKHPVKHLNQLLPYLPQIKINIDKCLMTLKMIK
jgi:hypothetical protein